MNQDNTYHHNVRVYAEDVDYMAIVYHANYLCFFEQARTEILRQNNLKLSELLEADTLFAITEANIRFLAPAKLDDLLTITTNFQQLSACRYLFVQEMKNQQDKLLCQAEIKAVCVTRDLKPKRFP